MLDKNANWVPATDPVHFDKPAVAGVGPAINFAKEMLGNNKNIKIGLVPCAWGGSPRELGKRYAQAMFTVQSKRH